MSRLLYKKKNHTITCTNTVLVLDGQTLTLAMFCGMEYVSVSTCFEVFLCMELQGHAKHSSCILYIAMRDVPTL